jgi:chloramphenicol 3-O phosphotransferase
MGLRPGEADHAIAPLVPALYAAFYDSIAAHGRAGLNVVADVGHHDPAVFADCARRLAGLPVLFVGVRCPIDVIMARRNSGQQGREREYAVGSAADPVPAPVLAWQTAVHALGPYDLEVDTSALTPAACAAQIRVRLAGPPGTAFHALARR